MVEAFQRLFVILNQHVFLSKLELEFFNEDVQRLFDHLLDVCYLVSQLVKCLNTGIFKHFYWPETSFLPDFQLR